MSAADAAAAPSTLEAALASTLSSARRAYAAWRPEVARYLFDKGLRPTGDALAEDVDRDRILARVWQLQMESIGTRMFGVSTDAWRDNPAYPDRFFPIAWIDLVPRLLPRLPRERRLPAVVAIFNLGENLVAAAPSLGGLVAEAMVSAIDQIAREGVELVALSILVDLGIVPASALPARETSGARVGTTWSRVVKIGEANVALWEPSLIPGALLVTSEGTVSIADRTRPLSLQLAVAGTSVQLIARSDTEGVAEPSLLPLKGGGLSVDLDGSVRAGDRRLGGIDPRGVAGVAIGPQGTLVISRRFSQRVEIYAARA